MDRGIVQGLVVLMLVSATSVVRAQSSTPPSDPSAQPPVGITPIRSLGDSINSLQYNPLTGEAVPVASGRISRPPDPSKPGAAIPGVPITNEPVSMTPIEPLGQSLRGGYRLGRLASLFRSPTDSTVIGSTSRTTSAAQLAATSPKPLLTDPSQKQTDRTSQPAQVVRARPAPRSDQIPDAARPQADPRLVPVSTTDGARLAPFARQIPQEARPQSPQTTVSERPRLDAPATSERPVQATNENDDPQPRAVKLPEPPPLRAIPSASTSTPAPADSSDSAPPPLPTLDRIEPIGDAPSVPAANEPATPVSVPAAETQPTALPAAPSQPEPAPSPGNEPPPGLPAMGPATGPVESAPQPSPPLESPAELPPSVARESSASPLPKAEAPATDNQLARTSVDQSAVKIGPARINEPQYITFTAAEVGNEIITSNELIDAVNEEMKKDPSLQRLDPGSPEYRMVENQIAAMKLSHLIEQKLILQDLHRRFPKGSKQEKGFLEFIEERWRSDELPVLCRRYAAANIAELRVKLKEQGKSYDSLRKKYIDQEMTREFLMGRIHNKLSSDVPEQLAYYNKHRNEFYRDAGVTWREIEIKVNRYPDRASAHRKAEDLLSKLLHNESFEALARTSSNGPTASRGGLYVDTTPGSYVVPGVNAELDRLPIGQVSQIIEAPDAFYIIKVESRREAGPLPFKELQNDIRKKVYMENTQKAVNEYLQGLRAKTLIRSMFETSSEGLVTQDRSAALKNGKDDPAVQRTSINSPPQPRP